MIAKVVAMDMAIQKAHNRIDHVIQDEASLRAYEMREKAIMDWNSAVSYHTREAKKEGKIEGKIEMARKMKADKEPIEKISRYSGLTEKQVKDL